MSETDAPWKWTRLFSIGLTVSVAGFCAWGALAPHISSLAQAAPFASGLLTAAFYGNAQGLANCMAANARRALNAGRGFGLPALFFGGCFVGFALLSMAGLHSAWAVARANADGAPLPDDGLMQWLFGFVALSEPAMNYGVEALKALHKQQLREEERQDLDDAADRDDRRRDADARRQRLHVVVPAAAATLATAPIAAEAQALPSEFPIAMASHSSPANPMAEAHACHGWSGPRDHAMWQKFMEATELGMAPMAIVREVGIPSTTVYRWRRLLRAKRE